MSILTRIFVVLVTLLSVLLVALIVPFVANTQNYKQLANDTAAQLAVAERLAQIKQEEINQALGEMNETVTKLRDAERNYQARITELVTTLADAQADVQQERAENLKVASDVSRLSASHEQFGLIMTQMQSELTERRERMLAQQTRVIVLTDESNELQSRIATLTRELRRMKERMATLEEENIDLTQTLERVDPQLQSSEQMSDARVFEPASRITGKVTQVQEHSGDTFVQMNVGTNDGVASGMKFYISRQNAFIGTAVVTAADAQMSAARIKLRQGNVLVDDTVETGGY